MKQTKFLFALFMAIVMMAMSPGRAWGHYVQVGDSQYELSEISLEGSPGLTATIELNKGDEIDIYFCESLVTRICPEGNNTLTNTGLSCYINYNWPGSITVADAGKYKLTFSEFIYTEDWVMHDENDPGSIEVAFAEAHLTIMPLDNHVHSYTEEITSEASQKIYPTCTAPGVYYKSCVCGAVSTSEDDTFEIPARGHNFIADHNRIVSAATCTEDAYYVGVCSRCQEESNVRDYGSKLGHDWHADADGVHHACQRCETQEEHTFDSYTVSESTFISEATCTSAALYHLSCRYCDAISQDNKDTFTMGNPLPHTWGDDDKCTVCHNDFNETGDYMIAQVCINDNECLDFSKEDMGANGKNVHIPEGASISVSLNWYNVYPESDLFIEETSSAVNLSFKETDYTNIYVENEGDYIINIRRPYFYSEYFEDEDRYETHASCILSIERHEHSYEDGVCVECGYECQHGDDISIVSASVPDLEYSDYVHYSESYEVIPGIAFEAKCNKCGTKWTQEDTETARVIEIHDLQMDALPTCTEEGCYSVMVDIRFYIDEGAPIMTRQYSNLSGNINSLGHTPVTDEAVDATCTESGLTEGLHCEVCREVIEAQEEIPALGHEFSYEQILCADGYHRFVCTREGCDLQSEEKYAKMFGDYKLVTGDENPTATIPMTKVGNKYYTSLYTDFPYHLSWTDDNNNTSTWTVSSAADGVVTLGEIDDVPANCGVIIIKYADEGSVAECTIEYAPHIYRYEETDASPLLTGSETDVTDPAANQYAFGLSDTGYLGFWHWPGMTIPAWKAYLDLGSETATEARGFRIVFDDETNGIQQLPADASAIEGSYDLMGRKVREVKGLGIVNGKKVFVNY